MEDKVLRRGGGGGEGGEKRHAGRGSQYAVRGITPILRRALEIRPSFKAAARRWAAGSGGSCELMNEGTRYPVRTAPTGRPSCQKLARCRHQLPSESPLYRSGGAGSRAVVCSATALPRKGRHTTSSRYINLLSVVKTISPTKLPPQRRPGALEPAGPGTGEWSEPRAEPYSISTGISKPIGPRRALLLLLLLIPGYEGVAARPDLRPQPRVVPKPRATHIKQWLANGTYTAPPPLPAKPRHATPRYAPPRLALPRPATPRCDGSHQRSVGIPVS